MLNMCERDGNCENYCPFKVLFFVVITVLFVCQRSDARVSRMLYIHNYVNVNVHIRKLRFVWNVKFIQNFGNFSI